MMNRRRRMRAAASRQGAGPGPRSSQLQHRQQVDTEPAGVPRGDGLDRPRRGTRQGLPRPRGRRFGSSSPPERPPRPRRCRAGPEVCRPTSASSPRSSAARPAPPASRPSRSPRPRPPAASRRRPQPARNRRRPRRRARCTTDQARPSARRAAGRHPGRHRPREPVHAAARRHGGPLALRTCTVPAKPRWLLSIPDAISQLEQLDRTLLTRRDVERLFGVSKARAATLMQTFGAELTGNQRTLPRTRLLQQLKKHRGRAARRQRLVGELRKARLTGIRVKLPVESPRRAATRSGRRGSRRICRTGGRSSARSRSRATRLRRRRSSTTERRIR